MYAIVDIETTGSYAAANGITEVAIVLHDGKEITGTYETLVNPQQPIPYFIQRMTGITNEMVEQAPCFHEVAAEIYEKLSNCVFVAHNVNFDYSFLRHQLKEQGYDLATRKLCTMRLTKKIFPAIPKYGLGFLCSYFNVQNKARHRAMGDAMATAELFSLLLKNESHGIIEQMLKAHSHEHMLPPHLPREQFLSLPAKPGVYYFHNQRGKVIYVGKAKNLKSRVSSHFSNNSPGRQKQNFLLHIHSISFEVCPTEFIAMLLESAEIKRLWPEFNRSQKKFQQVYGLFEYEDQNGFKRLSVDVIKKHTRPLEKFLFLNEGNNRLWQLVNEFGLCPKKCNLQSLSGECGREDHCICDSKKSFVKKYNKQVEKAVKHLKKNQRTYLLSEKGRTADEKTVLYVDKGVFIGFTYISEEETISTMDELKDRLRLVKENFYISYLIETFAQANPRKVKVIK